jgi:hypothetical protein
MQSSFATGINEESVRRLSYELALLPLMTPAVTVQMLGELIYDIEMYGETFPFIYYLDSIAPVSLKNSQSSQSVPASSSIAIRCLKSRS